MYTQVNDNPNEVSCASQNARILAYMQKGNRITSLEALHLFGCFRLASRISDLRKDNDIKDQFVKLSNGKRVKQYFIESES